MKKNRWTNIAKLHCSVEQKKIEHFTDKTVCELAMAVVAAVVVVLMKEKNQVVFTFLLLFKLCLNILKLLKLQFNSFYRASHPRTTHIHTQKIQPDEDRSRQRMNFLH